MFTKPKILLISKAHTLSKALIQNLSASGYQVSGDVTHLDQYRHIICLDPKYNLKLFAKADAKILLVLPYSLYPQQIFSQNNPRVTIAYVGAVNTSNLLNFVIKSLRKHLFSLDESGKEVVISRDVELTSAPSKTKRWFPVTPVISVLIILFIVPYILFGVSALGLYWGYQKTKAGDLEVSRQVFGFSGTLSGLTVEFFGLYNKLPLVGEIFTPVLHIATIAERSSRMGKEVVDLVKNIQNLSGKVLGDEIYSPADYGNRIFLNVDFLYNQITVLEGDIQTLPQWQIKLIGKYVSVDQIEDIKTKLYWTRSLARELPALLGASSHQTYLLLFQNNMELRPTGGFIGSFALITLDGGRLSDINVSDVYSADGQLKGYVAPPEPIKKYLGEVGWYLRDANWDPDFPTSAAKVEWFLDKEIGKSVDGVIGIDLEVAKSFLKISGPVKVGDYNLTVNENNLYEKTQSEVEKNFFPGSSKKASFLTALVRTLLAQTSDFSPQKNWPFLKSIYTNFQEKHIQVFLHNMNAQKFVSTLGYDGAVALPTCSGNCYADWLGIVDANLGVDKNNLYINRDARLTVVFNGDSLVRTLTIDYYNKATPALGEFARYKNYVRVLLPLTARILSTSRDFDRQDLNGRSEVGTLIEVMPGVKKSLELSWTTNSPLDLTQKGEYRLFWRKQAGTLADPIAIEIGREAKYNTSLSQDVFRTVTWK